MQLFCCRVLSLRSRCFIHTRRIGLIHNVSSAASGRRKDSLVLCSLSFSLFQVVTSCWIWISEVQHHLPLIILTRDRLNVLTYVELGFLLAFSAKASPQLRSLLKSCLSLGCSPPFPVSLSWATGMLPIVGIWSKWLNSHTA